MHPRRWGYAAAGWAGSFAAVHLHWALGGSIGLAESAGAELAEERPGWFVAIGLYGVAALLIVAAGLGWLLARGPRARRWRLLPLLGTGVGAVLVVRAVAVEALLLADAGFAGDAISSAQRTWTLLFWDPWFGGVAFLLAAAAARRDGDRSRDD